MIHVGLTGGIATGKSTVAKMFREKGAVLLSLDDIAHDVMEPGKPVWREIVSTFGDKILRDNKSINRKKLAKIVFKDKTRLKKLESIIHPAIVESWHNILTNVAKEKPDAVLISEVPLLFEKHLSGDFDATILVYAPPQIQIKRLVNRDSISPEEAKKRLEAQLPIDEKLQLATYVVYNDADLNNTRQQVDKLWNELILLQKKSPRFQKNRRHNHNSVN